MYICIYRMNIYINVHYRERANESLWVLMLGEGELGLSALGLGFAGFSGKTEEYFTTELHLEPMFTLPEAHYSAHTGLELILPHSAHCRYHVCTFTPISEVSLFVCRAFTLGSVHYSGYDNYVTKIWCICCLTTCLGVGCFVFSYLGKSFGKTILQKTTKLGMSIVKSRFQVWNRKTRIFQSFLQLHRSKTEHPLDILPLLALLVCKVCTIYSCWTQTGVSTPLGEVCM